MQEQVSKTVGIFGLPIPVISRSDSGRKLRCSKPRGPIRLCRAGFHDYQTLQLCFRWLLVSSPPASLILTLPARSNVSMPQHTQDNGWMSSLLHHDDNITNLASTFSMGVRNEREREGESRRTLSVSWSSSVRQWRPGIPARTALQTSHGTQLQCSGACQMR